MEEKLKNNNYDLITHNIPSMIWMHGKIWNRKFLQQYNLRFHPWLRTFEDTYFGKIVALSAPRTAAYHCDSSVYLWKRNENSVTANWAKDNRSYLYWRNDDFRECTYQVLNFLYPRYKEIERWEECFFSSLMFTYFVLQTTDLEIVDGESQQVHDQMEQLFVKMVVDFGETVKNTSNLNRSIWYNLVRTDFSSRFKFFIEQIPWNDFLKYIDNKYNIHSYDLFNIHNEELPNETK